MSSSQRLLILHDSPHFGGHEIMLLKLFPAVLASDVFSEIIFCFPESNAKLNAQLQQVRSSKLLLHPWRHEKRRGEPYFAPLRLLYQRRVRQIWRDMRPDLILLVQGRIENLSVPMLAIPPNQRVVSYIPMAHRLVEMGRAGHVGDRVRQRYYARPDRFIVPSISVANQLVRAGAKGSSVVVDNVVSLPTKLSQIEARHQCDLVDDGRKIALFLGRMDIAQKGIDLLASAIARQFQKLDQWRFVFVGDGPGATLLQELQSTGATTIDVVKWTERPQDYLAAADVLLMPSRWEGVPLAMLEAMTHHLPILASKIDVFREYLPAANVAEFRHVDLSQALETVIGSQARAQFVKTCSERLAAMSLAHSQQRFLEALTKW
jgi:glycosyltransferase involved in cell wall biosynthesis